MVEGIDSTSVVLSLVVILISTVLIVVFRNISKRRGSTTAAATTTITVSELYIYPIKSCGHIQVNVATATERGFENDRIAQVSDRTGKYCTPREKGQAKLFLVQQELLKTGGGGGGGGEHTLLLTAPEIPPIEVDLKGGSTKKSILAIPMVGPKVQLRDFGDSVAAWFEKATNIVGCRLTGISEDYRRIVEVNEDQGEAVPMSSPNSEASVSLADESPYLMTSTLSLVDLNKRLVTRGKDAIPMQRFRPNIVISSGSGGGRGRGLRPWEEDSLRKVRIGSVEFWVWQRCGRCAMTTIDRETLERSSEPLATLSTFRERANGQRNFGMHLVPVTPISKKNQIRVGDTVEILEYDEERLAEWERLFGTKAAA